jgi:hypothetical protein
MGPRFQGLISVSSVETEWKGSKCRHPGRHLEGCSDHQVETLAWGHTVNRKEQVIRG